MTTLFRRSRGAVAALCGAMALLSACGGDPSDDTAASSGGEADPTEFSPQEFEPLSLDPAAFTPMPLVGYSGSLTDSQGYTFDFSLSSGAVDVRPDVANSAPGRTTLSLSIHGVLRVTNTTPERNAPLTAGGLAVRIGPAYPPGAAVCEFSDNAEIADYDVSDFTTYIVLGCAAPVQAVLSNQSLGEQPPLGPGESTVFSLEGERVIEVPEELAATVQNELAEPPFWIGSSSAGVSVDGWTDDALPQDCRLSARYDPIVWASTPLPGCSVPAVGSDLPLDVPATLVSQAEDALAALVAGADDPSSAVEPESCPLGDIREVTRGTSDRPVEMFTVSISDNFGHPGVSCFADPARVFVRQTEPDDELTAAVIISDQEGPYAVSAGVPLHGGTAFVSCPPDTGKVCFAAWRSEGMVVYGFAGGYTAQRDVEFQARWLATNLPAMLERLAAS